MHIFTNPNFDFVKWKWHAIAVSWIVILVGVFVSIQQLVLWNYVKDFYQNGIFTDSPGAWTETWIDK